MLERVNCNIYHCLQIFCTESIKFKATPCYALRALSKVSSYPHPLRSISTYSRVRLSSGAEIQLSHHSREVHPRRQLQLESEQDDINLTSSNNREDCFPKSPYRSCYVLLDSKDFMYLKAMISILIMMMMEDNDGDNAG